MLKKSLIALAALSAILFFLFYPKVYVLRGSAGGVLYWNANEALLFIAEGSDGARMNYVRYALEPLLVSMGDVRAPDDKRCSRIFVIRITDKDAQVYDTDLYRYTGESSCSFEYRLFADHFYAVSWPRLWKWSGDSFERATPDEYGAYAAALASGKTTSQHPWEFDNVDGWSMRAGLGLGSGKYSFTLNRQPVTIVSAGKTWPPAPVSVALIRLDQPPQTIWSLDGRPHRVGKVEYQQIFGKQ